MLNLPQRHVLNIGVTPINGDFDADVLEDIAENDSRSVDVKDPAVVERAIRKTYHKRSFEELRDSITSRLKERPATVYGLMRTLKCSRQTIYRHLAYLMYLRIVTRTEETYKGKKVVLYSIAK